MVRDVAQRRQTSQGSDLFFRFGGPWQLGLLDLATLGGGVRFPLLCPAHQVG